MKIVVKAYSVFKDALGNEVELELSTPLTIKELLEILGKRYSLPKGVEVLVIVDDNVVDENYVIDRDTTVHLAPPFSGGGRIVDVKILDENLEVDFNKLLRELMSSGAGALSVFIGFVKKHVDNHEVYELEYSAIDSTVLKRLERIAREEAEKHDLNAVVVWHYLGKRRPGDVTVIIATVAQNRVSALSATRSIIERIKKEAPIFKLEKRSDGEYWVIGDAKRYPRRTGNR